MESTSKVLASPPPHPGLSRRPVYLDYNATTPVDPRVAQAMWPQLIGHFGNPSSGHPYADDPRRALAVARGQLAALVGAEASRIVFTGSGSEANLLALRGAVLAAGRPRPHVVTQATEHPSVLQTCEALARLHQARVTVLPVDRRPAHGRGPQGVRAQGRRSPLRPRRGTAPSPVLSAMGADPDRVMAAVRLSVGRWTTPADVWAAAEAIAEAAA